jgi:protein ImuA
LALSAEALRRRGVVWIVEDMAAREIGLPYGVGLKALGLDPAKLVLVRTRGGPETLAAMEEALKSRAAATIAESWSAPSAYDLKASRRLLLAQRRGGGLGLLLMLRAGGEAQRLTSAAPVRVEIAAPAPLPAERPPPPAPPLWRLRVAKARAGGRAGAFDPLVWRGVAFHPDKAELHAFRERVPALSADRPAPARRAFA